MQVRGRVRGEAARELATTCARSTWPTHTRLPISSVRPSRMHHRSQCQRYTHKHIEHILVSCYWAVWCKVGACLWGPWLLWWVSCPCWGSSASRPKCGAVGEKAKGLMNAQKRGAVADLEHEEVPGLLVQATHLVHGQALRQYSSHSGSNIISLPVLPSGSLFGRVTNVKRCRIKTGSDRKKMRPNFCRI